MKALADEEARARIRDDLDTTLVVEAAAGTGKTTALVSRVVSVLRSGRAELDRIVAVTFTEAAAGEMKLRLRAELESARTDASTTDDERKRLDSALAQLEAARMSTIHALCSDLLRESPVEARVDPLFQVAPEDTSRAIFEEAFDLWFQRTLENPTEGVRRLLRRKKRGRDARGPRETLCNAAFSLLGHRDFATPLRKDPFDRDAGIDRLLASLAEVAPIADRATKHDDKLRSIFLKIAFFVEEVRRREAVRGRDYDGLEAELHALSKAWEWDWKGYGDWYERGKLRRADVFATRDRVKGELDSFMAHAEAHLAACLHEELSPLAIEYDVRKAREGRLDFLDLLLRTRDLVVNDARVRRELQARFTHLFVDEFQDTDPMQAEILLLLSADDPDESDWTRVRPVPGKLFVVGDPKQSIYRFRRADVALYESIKRRLAGHGAQVLYLSTSFRSAPSIQEAVNASFSMRMMENEPGTQARYVPLQPFREDPKNQPTIVALPVPLPYGEWGRVTKSAIEGSCPDAVGAFLDHLLRQSGWKVTERAGSEPVPIEARHVCLLFKRMVSFETDMTRAYVRALEARRIPHVLVGGRSFHTREEVIAVRSALAAIEWPDDELSVYATLRGPFFALGDDLLLAFKDITRSLHPLRKIEIEALPEAIRPVGLALAELAKLHRGRNRRPIADTLARFLDVTRAHAGIAIWPTGEQSLGNVLRVIDFARRFERAGATSFRAFIGWLDDNAESGQATEAPVVEEGTDGVRIMSVHKSKGLEFPVVVLVDPTAPMGSSSPTRHVDHDRRLWAEKIAGCVPIELHEHEEDALRRDEEEALRVAYVAATRARDMLVVPVIGDERPEGWLEVLNPSLYPTFEKRRDAIEPKPATGLPKFRGDSVVNRPEKCRRTWEDSVMPGVHRPERGRHAVLWWDPFLLDLHRVVDVGLRQQKILEADESGAAAEAGERAHEAWKTRRDALLAKGEIPTLRTETVTERSMRGASTGDAIEVLRTEVNRDGHPRGSRFGTLVHAVLALVPLDADDAHVRTLAISQARLLGATEQEIDACVIRVGAALKHPILKLASTNEHRREVAVVLPIEDTLVEGVIDLAVREGDRWLVIDFKTDAELGKNRDKYDAQVRLYMQAIEASTGLKTRGVLLSV